METPRTTRRDFLADLARTAAAAALASQLPILTTLTGCASGTEHFAHLGAAEAATMRAFAAQILPTEPGSPGAEEAGVVDFVDRAFGDPFFADIVPVVRSGLAELDAHARAAGEARGFGALSDAEQAGIIRQMSSDPFFAAARTLVLIGTFADSSHGGNRGSVGWAMVGIEHRPSFTAPFGWYDAQAAAESGGVAT